MDQVILPAATVQAVMDYLAKQPWGKVNGMLMALSQAKKVTTKPATPAPSASAPGTVQ